MPSKIDATGHTYGELTGVRQTEEKSGKAYKWEWLCSCGNTHLARLDHVRAGKIDRCYQCSCLSRGTHRMSDSLEYSSWDNAIQRCNPNSKYHWKDYTARGITVSDAIKDSFEYFLSIVGKIPDDGKKYSLGRIDNDLGYIEGNIRWETIEQQARNRRRVSTNKSGVTGVCWVHDRQGNPQVAMSQSYTLDGEHISKAFSVSKYGKEEAFRLACEHRAETIAMLNEQGDYYSEKHGL